jgi:predicted AlkP superfamily phosphohydrolase/phosphomutase/predicted Zn-dependent protease
MVAKNKILLVGWDAADWKVINELMDAGKMPALQSLVERGTMGNMRTLHPPLSPMLWTSIATGKRPYKHGITGFIEPTRDGKAIQPMTNLSRSSKAIWNILNQNNHRSVVVGWWPSHPAEPIDGVMVSDLFHKAPAKPGDDWGLRQGCVYPSEMQKELETLRVHPLELTAEDLLQFVPHGRDIDQENDQRLATLAKMISECSTVHVAATHLLEQEEWDFAAVYYDAIDHFSHGYMRYRAPQQSHISDEDFRIYRDVVDMGYIFHDMMLRQLLSYADDQTHVLIVSDHGFHSDHLRPRSVPMEMAGPAVEHRDQGIIVAAGPRIKSDHIVYGANLLDITPTILQLADLPVGRDMDGKVLSDMFTESLETEYLESWESLPGKSGQHPVDATMAVEDSKSVLDQLVALGYINRPDADTTKEVASCSRELKYNLAQSYMDAQLHGKAAPILYELYLSAPLEFRFGIQLAACFRALEQLENLKSLLSDMDDRWRKYSKIAKDRLSEIAQLARKRRDYWEKTKANEEENTSDDIRSGSTQTRRGKPILFDQGERREINKIRAIAKGNTKTLDFLRASLFAAEGKQHEAIEVFEAVLSSDPGNPLYYYHLGIALLDAGSFEEAERILKKGTTIDEYHPPCWMALSRCYLRQQLPAAARDAANRALGLQYYFPTAHFYLGKALAGLGNYSAAIQSFNVAIDQNPNFSQAYRALERIYVNQFADPELSLEYRKRREQIAVDQAQEKSDEPAFQFNPLAVDVLSEHLPSLLSQHDSPDFDRALGQIGFHELSDSEGGAKAEVTIVSGLPRSGTSMMMQMLGAGGLRTFTDGVRIADESNPEGYYEADLAKDLASCNTWLHDCDGQVVKVVAPLIQYLPCNIHYRVILMERSIDQVMRSQSKMLERMGLQQGDEETKALGFAFMQQLSTAVDLLKYHGLPTLRLRYADVVSNPKKACEAIQSFLGGSLHLEAMAGAVQPALFREQSIAKEPNGLK